MRIANTSGYRVTAVLLICSVVFALSACGTHRYASSCEGGQTLTVAGPPVQTRAMAVFRTAWVEQCPDRVFSYQVTDPADAVSRFLEGKVDIAGIHSALSPDVLPPALPRCDDGPALHLPMIFRSISLPYNLPGVGDLVLTGELIAKIFTGSIINWADPQILAVNPGSPLPDLPVIPVLPQEDSVVTEDFTAYLRTVGPSITGFPAVLSVRAGRASTAVPTVAQTPGAITYTTHESEAVQLPSVRIDSGVGPVAPTNESAMQAIDAAEFEEAGNDLTLAMDTLYRTRAPGGYPLIGVSYDLVCSKGYDARTRTAVQSFLETAATIDQAEVAQAGYVPLPPFLRDRIRDVVESLQ